MKPTLRRNFAWNFAGNLIYTACQWGMLVALAKLGSPEMVGQFALGLAVTAPVIVLSNLQLRSVQATDANGEFTFSQYFSLRVITTLLALAIIALFNFSSAVTLLIGLAKGLESMSDVIYGLLQRHERMRFIAVAMILKGMFVLPALALAIAVTHSVAYAAGAMVIVWAAVLLAYEVPVLRRLGFGVPGFEWDRAAFIKLTLMTLPLGLVTMLVSLNVNIPRYFVEHYQGRRALGIYAALSYVPIAGQALINAIGQAASPRLSVFYAERRLPQYVGLLAKVAALSLGIGLLMIAIAALGGDPLLALLYQTQYTGQHSVFVLLIIGATIGFVASIFGYAATATRYFRVQLPMFCLVVLTTLAACAFLVPSRGLTGAAIALLLASIVQAVLFAGIVIHACRTLPKRVAVR